MQLFKRNYHQPSSICYRVFLEIMTNNTTLAISAILLANVTSVPRKLSFAEGISWDDATWILTSSFIIFTMQSGFGLLESGVVSCRNEANIMVKNAVDVIFGGIAFWLFGFGLAFGEKNHVAQSFVGLGYFCLDSDVESMGFLYTWYIFQLSFATTTTTIVSGAMAERAKLLSYIVFSFFNTLIYCIPAHWIWSQQGFLYLLGAVDIAGSGAVHLVGGVTGLVATIIMKPRLGRFEKETSNHVKRMGSPTNSILGMFMLWWGWLGFNCGSTFGISGGKWKLAARSAVATLNASMGGGAGGIIVSLVLYKGMVDISMLINAVLGSLVSITAMCALAHPWEALVVGFVGALLTCATPPLLERVRIDDPVGVVPVHLVCGVWGLLACGFFTDEDTIQNLTHGRAGLFRGGGAYMLGIQVLTTLCLIVWTAITSTLLLMAIKTSIGLRLREEDERKGADLVEHGILNKEEVTIIVRKALNAAQNPVQPNNTHINVQSPVASNGASTARTTSTDLTNSSDERFVYSNVAFESSEQNNKQN